VLVPRKALQEILRFEGEETSSTAAASTTSSFAPAGRELVCRILEGTFPDYERVIASNNDKKPSRPPRVLRGRPARGADDRRPGRGVRLDFAPRR
jgi:hypothetical protein